MLSRPDNKASRQPARGGSVPTDGFIETFKSRMMAKLTGSDVLWGLVIAVLLALILVSFRYQTIPPLHVGQRAPVDVRASHDMTIEDLTATLGKRNEVMRKVPAIFDYDVSVFASLQQMIQKLFAAGRNTLSDFSLLGRSPDKGEEAQVVTSLKGAFGDSVPEEVLALGYRYGFAKSLEDQIISLLKSVMEPGIITNKELIVQQQRNQSDIRVVNVAAGHDKALTSEIQDVLQARQTLRQNSSRLTTANAADHGALARFLETLVTPNVFFNQSETSKRRNDAAEQVSRIIRHVPQGKVIVHAGELVTEDVMVELDALKRSQELEPLLQRALGSVLLCLIFMYVIWHYFVYHQKRHRKIRNHFILIMLVLCINLITTRLAIYVADLLHGRMTDLLHGGPADFLHGPWGANILQDATAIYYAIPLAFGAILITLLVDVQIAVLYALFFGVLIGLSTSSITMACYVLIGSFAAIYGIKQYKERSAIIKAGFVIGLVNLAAFVALDLFDAAPPSLNALGIKALCGLASGMMAAMLASLLLPALESLFRITTDIKLLELSNLNTPILRRMAVEAPGTYHHSIAVGTLAEAAAEAIGANPLVVRVAALYHDIGKMKMSEYYVENQIFSQNKHDKLAPRMSSLIIANHVNAGLAMADEIRLMPRIRDMIPQHHGTRLMTYFYEKAKAAGKDAEINPSDFRYPGPKPQSREAAIMMLADAVEAASRTLTDPSPTQIQGMIRRIIDAVVSDGQFSECDITFKDLSVIEQAMLRVLSGAYHHRIEYPGYDFSKLKSESTTAK